MLFWLGTDHAEWLGRSDVPLLVSRSRLAPRRSFPRALGAWALDSGGFSQIHLRGGWSLSAADYAADVRRYADEIGGLDWAAPQDWMCEPSALAATGLTVAEHQARTVDNFGELRAILGPLVVPVLQGWELADYLRCADLYARAGFDLARERLVGLGTVCRRQDTEGAASIVVALSDLGLRLHGFGVKLTGLRKVADRLESADSMAWSFRARKEGRPLIAEHTHRTCHHCLPWALEWRRRVLAAIAEPLQTRWV